MLPPLCRRFFRLFLSVLRSFADLLRRDCTDLLLILLPPMMYIAVSRYCVDLREKDCHTAIAAHTAADELVEDVELLGLRGRLYSSVVSFKMSPTPVGNVTIVTALASGDKKATMRLNTRVCTTVRIRSREKYIHTTCCLER